MSIEVQKPLINITRETAGVPGPGGNTDLEFNNVLQGQITDGTTIDVNLEDPNGNPVTPLSVGLAGNTLSIEIGVETPVEVNAVPVGDIPNGPVLFVNCEDPGGNPITPNSATLTGSQLDIVFPAPVVPSGVALQFPNPDMHTSYRTGDVGWRLQNNWFNYTPPANPAKFAQLNMALGINYWYNLLTPLTVNGVSSATRFVDVDGGQTFSASGNKNKVLIDKLTGLMWVRDPRVAGGANCLWDDAIDRALAYSVVVNGVTYDDWYLPSMTELISLFPFEIAQSGMFQGIVTLIDAGSPATQLLWTATTTSQSNTSRAMRLETSTSRIAMSFGTKTTDLFAVYMVRKATNLIS